MRINKEKFPILDILRMSKEEFAIKNPLIYGGDSINLIEKSDWSPIEQMFKDNIETFGRLMEVGDVDMVSNTFMRNIFENTSLYEKLNIRDLQVSGVMMFNIGITILYDFRNPDSGYFISITDGNIVSSMGGQIDGDLLGFADSYATEGKIISKQQNVEYIHRLIVFTLLFKHYAKVETIHVKPKEKVRDPNSKEKHFNETDIPINILDCRWFNNIIRDEPFGVRGHFRLQPKKDETGKWIKEMIYIKPFIKKGYNSKARKLN